MSSLPTHTDEGLTLGPVQMLIVGFQGDNFDGSIMKELDRLKEHDIVRLIDLLFVKKNEDGEIEVVQRSDLGADEAEQFGAIVGALVGFGADGEEGAEYGALAGAAELEDGHVFDDDAVWYLGDAIPEGTAAAVALLEHRWAIPLRDKIAQAGGLTLSDAWIHVADLVAVGAIAAAKRRPELHAGRAGRDAPRGRMRLRPARARPGRRRSRRRSARRSSARRRCSCAARPRGARRR